MRVSWKIGRIAGIDLFLHPTFLILLAFVGLTYQDGLAAVALVSAVFGCVVLHELGHALMARRFGIRTADITLYPIGGVARLERMPRAPGAELLIALAGPAVNVALALFFLALGMLLGALVGGLGGALAAGLLSTLVAVNLVLALFNLIPAFPMDGGRVLRAVLSGWLGRVRATRVAAQIGQVLAMVFAVYTIANNGLALNQSLVQVALAAFVFLAARAELAHVEAEERIRRGSVNASGIWVAPPGYTWVSRGPGVWQLIPIAVPASDPASPWR